MVLCDHVTVARGSAPDVTRKRLTFRIATLMSSNFKPDQYSTVSPYLIAAGAQKVIEFLKKAFGASELRRFDLPDGSIMHAEVRIGDTVVMIGDAGQDWPAAPAHIHVYVEDVDVTFDRALDAGGVLVQRPERKNQDPDRRGGVKDPAGNTWWIATQVS